MGDAYKRLAANALVTDQSRTVYNDTIDMLRWWKRQPRTGAGSQTGIIDWDQSLFPIKNNSGTDLTASYGVLGISKPLYSPTDSIDEFLNVTALEGVEPTVEDHAGGKWCVVLEPLANGEISRKACLSGVVPVRVYVNAVNDKSCDVIAAKTVGSDTVRIGTGSNGAQILWRENNTSGAGTIVWALIRLGGSGATTSICWGRLTEEVRQSGKGQCLIYKIDNPPDGNWIATSPAQYVTAYPSLLIKSNDYYPSGTYVQLAYSSECMRWNIMSPFCAGGT
jgi:hypothetical protein